MTKLTRLFDYYPYPVKVEAKFDFTLGGLLRWLNWKRDLLSRLRESGL